jgi:hypothetical protein
MLKMRLAVIVVVALALAIPTRGLAMQTSASVDYDTFMQLDLDGRIRIFNEVTPENKAALVQTQIRRWIEQNRPRLTSEQLKMMEENLAFATTDLYRQPKSDEQRAKGEELEKRTSALFSFDDMMQALTIYGTYIPKKN